MAWYCTTGRNSLAQPCTARWEPTNPIHRMVRSCCRTMAIRRASATSGFAIWASTTSLEGRLHRRVTTAVGSWVRDASSAQKAGEFGNAAEVQRQAITLLRGSGARRLIITMPMDIPKLLQLYEFNVAIGEAEVDGPRKFLARQHPARGRRGRNASVPG